jgi:hypothetical protein
MGAKPIAQPSTNGLRECRDCRKVGGASAKRAFSRLSSARSGRVVWILWLVKIGAEAGGQAVDVMEINRPDDLGDIADLGLTLAETKRLSARLQQEIIKSCRVIVTAMLRPPCVNMA